MELNVISSVLGPLATPPGEWVRCNRCQRDRQGTHLVSFSPLSSLITVSTGGLVVQLPLFRERRVLLGNYNSIIVSGQMYGMAAIE